LNDHSRFPPDHGVAAEETGPRMTEVGEAISEFNSAAGNLLRGWPAPANTRAQYVLVTDQLRSINASELKSDRGWVVMLK